jgi:hypothetical protein
MGHPAHDRPPQAERAAFAGICEQCGQPVRGRQDKRFCRDACRTRFGRERKAIEEATTRAALVERLDPCDPGRPE